MTCQFSIRVSAALYERLTEAAQLYNITIADIMRRALKWMQRVRKEGQTWETVKDSTYQGKVVQVKQMPAWLTEDLDHPDIRSGLVLYLEIHAQAPPPRRFTTTAQIGRDYLVVV